MNDHGVQFKQARNKTTRKQQKKMSTTETTGADQSSIPNDPLLTLPSSLVQDGDHLLLVFSDGKQILAQAVRHWRGQTPPCKINKRTYSTHHLIGLPYGTICELGPKHLTPLVTAQSLLPEFSFEKYNTTSAATATSATTMMTTSKNTTTNGREQEEDQQQQQQEGGETNNSSSSNNNNNNNNSDEDSTFPPILNNHIHTNSSSNSNNDNNKNTNINNNRDNRHIVDTNTSQRLNQDDVRRMRAQGWHGAAVVETLVQHSTTFGQKSDYAQAKYVQRKQKKYQPRCRLVRCTAATIAHAMFVRDPKKIMNLRDDTLGQILSYANLSAGCQALVWEQSFGIVTGAVAQRLGGYGRVLSVYSGQQPSWSEMIQRFNLSFAEHFAIKWLHSEFVFASHPAAEKEDEDTNTAKQHQQHKDEVDEEQADRDVVQWPCPLQSHTRNYLKQMTNAKEKERFLAKRAARLARKLTRHTQLEAKEWLLHRPCDCIILAVRYDPIATLIPMLRFLAPSCPFVVYSEFIEPLTECFLKLQQDNLAINLRLSDTWTREYQVLPGRTHPNMTMSQSGGFLLTGIKLDPVTGTNELDDELLKEIRAEIGGRRGKKPKHKRTAEENAAGQNGGDSAAKQNGKRKKEDVVDLASAVSSSSAKRSKQQEDGIGETITIAARQLS